MMRGYDEYEIANKPHHRLRSMSETIYMFDRIARMSNKQKKRELRKRKYQKPMMIYESGLWIMVILKEDWKKKNYIAIIK
jgi:hypothetical protein